MTQERRVLRRLPSRIVRSYGVTERHLKEMSQQPDNLCVEEEQGILVAEPLGERLALHYGFTNQETMRTRFGPLLKQLIEAAKGRGQFENIFLLFADQPMRTYLDPLFGHNGFEPREEWFVMQRAVLESDANVTAEAPGITLRPAAIDDLDSMVALGATAFGGQRLSRDALAALGEKAAYLSVAVGGDGLAGYLPVMIRSDRAFLGPLVVRSDWRDRGVGRSLVRHALAWLSQNEVWKADAPVSPKDPHLHNLSRELGFTQQQMGITYVRPLEFVLKPTLDIPRYEPKRLGVWGIKPGWG